MSLATEKTRCPALPSASPMAMSSSAAALVPAASSPSLARCRMVRVDDAPMAPACTASRTMAAISAISSARRRVVGAALAEHVGAERTVRHETGHVEHPGRALHFVEVLAEGLPVPVHALGQRAARDVLHALHELDEPGPVRLARRCEADAAVAHHDGGHPVPARRRHLGVPGGLPVVVRVDVDPARRHQEAVGVDFAAPLFLDLADGGDDAAVDGDVAGRGRATRAVGNGAAPDDQVVHGVAPLRRTRSARLRRAWRVPVGG